MTAPKLTDRSARSIHASLVEFGYPVTLEEVTRIGNGLLDGSVTRDSDIIAMFIHGMLRDAGAFPESGDGR